MNIELVKLTTAYKTQLFDMLTEWKADIEKNHTNHSPWMIFRHDFHDFDYYLENLKPLTIAQKGFLHDKERMISSVLINEKMTDRTLMNAVGRLLIKFLLLLFRTRTRFRFPCWTAQ